MSKHYLSTAADSDELSITVYNDNFGTVKERRKIELSPETTMVTYMDVAAKIETDSLLIQGLRVHELNYDFDLVNKRKLLEKYLDRTVYLKQDNGEAMECRLLSVSGGLILENCQTREIYLDPKEELILPKLPEGLIIKPALVWKIPPQSANAIKVSYLTKGFRWIANYVMELKDTECTLNGWANITNETGSAYANAKIKLIAGSVKRVLSEAETSREDTLDMVILSSMSEPSFVEQSFSDYHMYTLTEPVTLKDNQSKQIQFLQAERVPCRIYYDCSTRESKAAIIVELQNKAEHNLGLPLPKGKIKVYRQDDADGQLEFIGEDAIDHTPNNENISLHIGDAFDLVCEHEMKDLKKEKGITIERHVVTLRNHKQQAASVRLSHYVPHRNYKVAETSHTPSLHIHKELVFEFTVPANQDIQVTFQIEVDETISVKMR